jgi:hypothetical protein
MKRAHIAAAVAGATAAVTGSVLVAIPSLAGSSAATHTINFVAVSAGNHNFDKTHSVSADKDKHNGEVIGFDTLSCVAATTGQSAKCNVAASFKRGIIYGTFTIQFSDGSLSGHVTGGTRHFQGATGTITGSAQSNNREKVKIVYQT